jgi:four helix bundle protein
VRRHIPRVGHFKQLKAWQHARSVAVLSKAAIAGLPGVEANTLADQWRRASYSVALNIAEGASRRGTKEFRKHLDIARASLHELEAIMELAVSLGYFRAEELAKLEATTDGCARTVYGLLRKFSDTTSLAAR